MSDVETEIKFLITNYCAQNFVEEIIRSKPEGWAWTTPLTELTIHDSYFDTLAHDLRKLKWGLRVRSKNKEKFITLKGPSVVTRSGALERQEFEDRLDDRSMRIFLDRIRSLGVRTVPEATRLSNPGNWLESQGLAPVQKRKTIRMLRKIGLKDSQNPIAEMSLDTVYYEIAEFLVIHVEVEIESTRGIPTEDFERLIDVIKIRLPVGAREWRVDKLALGFLLDELHQQGVLRGMIDSNHRLLDKSYDLIKNLLSNTEEKS